MLGLLVPGLGSIPGAWRLTARLSPHHSPACLYLSGFSFSKVVVHVFILLT